MKITLRARLAILYGTLVAVTLVAFALVAYVTVSSELYRNLDASLSRAGTSLLSVLRKEQSQAKKPLAPLNRSRRQAVQRAEEVSILDQGSLRDYVGPIAPTLLGVVDQDPVWSAVYEHMLLNSSNYLMQVVDKSEALAWRSDNLVTDTLPHFHWFETQGASVVDDRIFTYYWLRGERYRLVLTRGDIADVTVAYPASEIDATLRRLFSLMLYALPAAILLSIGLGWFIAGRSLRPVDVITKSARQITASNLGLRLPMPVANDEIARLTETLNDMIARLEKSFAQIQQFTSDASHELKTPLAILMGELELALRSTMAANDYRNTLASCLEEVERLTHVVQGLLDLSRAESGQVMIVREELRLDRLVADVCDDIALLAETRNIDLQTEIAPNVLVMGDRVRLHQAVLNVVENAIKYTADHGSVRVELKEHENRVQLTIADTGVGIPADQLQFIFDRFYRVDKSRSRGIYGTGLGLSIVKWIVDVHGGTIEAMSADEKGTTVTITLPGVGSALVRP